MNQVDKNEILQQVGVILQYCQEIVSQLSSPSSPCSEFNNNSLHNVAKSSTVAMEASITEHYSDQIGELANFDKEAQKKLIESIAKVGDEEQEDIPDDDDLWWDTHYPPSHFYTLVYEDDDLSLFGVDEDSYEENDPKVPDSSSTKDSMSSSITLPSSGDRDYTMSGGSGGDVTMPVSGSGGSLFQLSEDAFQTKLMSFFAIATQDCIYNINWREAQRRKAVHPMFYSVWSNYESIFSDAADDDSNFLPVQQPEIRYPSIDLYNVNARFIGNIPKPSLFPIHGVSADPDFYHKWYPRGDPYKQFQKFREPNPFGSEYGYDTNIGVVLPSTEPVHGYIWCRGEGWKLYAVKPGDSDRTSQRSRRRA